MWRTDQGFSRLAHRLRILCSLMWLADHISDEFIFLLCVIFSMDADDIERVHPKNRHLQLFRGPPGTPAFGSCQFLRAAVAAPIDGGLASAQRYIVYWLGGWRRGGGALGVVLLVTLAAIFMFRWD